MPRYFGIIFGAVGSEGWSEVYPITATSYVTAAGVLSTLFTARRGIADATVAFIGTRLSDTDVKGDSFPTGITTPVPGTFAGTGTYNPQVALRMLQHGDVLRRGTRWVRAIPKDEVNGFGAYVPSVGFAAAMATYQGALVAGVSIATKIKGAVAPPFYLFTPITAVDAPQIEARRIGRPFGLPRGRRIVA